MPQTILIVDDSKEYAALLDKCLRSEGFQTAVVHDGQAALEKARSVKPDLILLDIMMPNIGGTEVRNELLKDTGTQAIPVIFLTGLRAPHPSKKPSASGMRVIGKSKDFRELLAVIRDMLAKAVRS